MAGRVRLPRRVGLLLVLLAWQLVAGPVLAHRPHDDVQHLAFVSGGEGGQIGLVVVRNNLLRAEITADGWQPWGRSVKGLTNRYGISSLMVSDEPRTAYLSAEGDGVFVTRDGGLSWSALNAGLTSRDVAILAVGAGEGGMVLAADRAEGRLWSFDHAEGRWTQSAEVDHRITAAAIAPGGKILLGTSGSQVLLRDETGTVTPIWSADGPQVTDIALLPGERSARVLVATDGAGLWRSETEDSHFVPVLPGQRITDIAVSPRFAEDHTIIATSWTSVFISDDGGDTWHERDSGLARSSQAETARYLSPHFRKAAFLDAPNGARGAVVAGYSGLFQTADSGASWAELPTLPANIIMAFAVSEPDGDGLHAIAVGSYGAGIAVSEDEGHSWVIARRGMPDARARDVAFSPDYQTDGLLIGAIKGSVLYARGPRFVWKEQPLRPKGASAFFVSIIRPPVESLMRASKWFSNVMNKYAPRPDPELTAHPSVIEIAADGQILVGTSRNGLFASPSLKADFARIAEFPEGEISAIASEGIQGAHYVASSAYLEPPDPDSHPVLYRSGTWTGTWTPLPLGDRVNGRLKIGVGAKAGGHRLLAASNAGLWVSQDDGQTWHRPTAPEAVRAGAVAELGISPDFANDQTVLVSVKGLGLFKSDDGGETFLAVGDDLRAAGVSVSHPFDFPAASSAIRFSPDYARNGVIFGATGYGIVKSVDRGQTWQAVPVPDLGSVHQ